MMRGLLLRFTQHVRDCFHFTAIVKGWFLALQSQAFPKWLAVFAGMPEVMLCHNTQGLWSSGRGGLCTSVSETAEGEGFAGGEAQQRHFGTEKQRLQQQNEVSHFGLSFCCLVLAREQKSSPQNVWDLFLLWARDFLAASQGDACSLPFLLPVVFSFSSLFLFPLRKNPINNYKNPLSKKPSF